VSFWCSYHKQKHKYWYHKQSVLWVVRIHFSRIFCRRSIISLFIFHYNRRTRYTKDSTVGAVAGKLIAVRGFALVQETPVAAAAPSRGEAEELDLERIFGVLPVHERSRLAGHAHLDVVIDPLDPEGLVIVVVDNVGRVDVDLVRFGLVQTNGRLGVAPATDEDFDHGRVDGIAAEQGDVGVVFALDVEGDLLPALGLAADATQVVVAVVVVRVDIGGHVGGVAGCRNGPDVSSCTEPAIVLGRLIDGALSRWPASGRGATTSTPTPSARRWRLSALITALSAVEA